MEFPKAKPSKSSATPGYRCLASKRLLTRCRNVDLWGPEDWDKRSHHRHHSILAHHHLYRWSKLSTCDFEFGLIANYWQIRVRHTKGSDISLSSTSWMMRELQGVKKTVTHAVGLILQRNSCHCGLDVCYRNLTSSSNWFRRSKCRQEYRTRSRQ